MYSAVLPGTDDYTLEYIQMSKISPRFSEDYIRTRKTKKTLSIRFTVCHMMWSRCIPYTSFPNLVASWYFDEKKSCIVEYYTFFAHTATRMYQGLYLHKRNRVSLPRSSFHLVSYESQKAEFNISIDDKRCPIEEKGNGIYLFFTPKRIQ